MKRSTVYNYLTSALIATVLALSTCSTIVSAQVLQSAQNSSDPVLNNLNAKADNSNSLYSNNPTATSYLNSPDTSANSQSRNNNGLSADATGGSGNAPTSFMWKMLMPWYWVQATMKIIGNTILMIFGWVLGLVGLIFNLIIDKTIVNLKSTIDSLGVITDIWKTIRDFINLFFIFALLYAAVGTVLGIDKVDWKKTVGNLILAALLINFSLFITKAVLDISNIVTIGFYSQLPGVGAGDINPTNLNNSTATSAQQGGISNSIMQSLKLETIYKPNYSGGSASVADANNDSMVGSFAFILSTVMGSIFICVTIVVMIAACWLFLRRFIDVLFLMIRSPIAFAGLVLPKLESYQADWWSDLQKNAVFPPVYMAMMWITFKILQSPGFQTVAPGTDGFGDAFKSLGPTTINIVFRFIIVIMMMVYALKSAGKVGVEGGEIFTDYLKKKKGQLQGVVGRNTLGRAAAWAQNKDSAAGQALRNLEAVPIIGKATSGAIRDSLKDVSGNDFGGAKGGFDAALKAKAKEAKEGYARVGEKAEFNMRIPIKPDEPVRAAGDTDAMWVTKVAKFTDANDRYEEEKKTYDAKKEAHEKVQKETAKARQEQYRNNYAANVVTSEIGGNGPLFAGNAAALKAVDEKIKEDKKKEDKKNDQVAEFERQTASWITHLGEEIRAAMDPNKSPQQASFDPNDPKDKSWADLKQSVATEFEAKLKEVADTKDPAKKAELIEGLRKKYQEVEDKIVEDEVEVLEKIEYELGKQSTTPQAKDELFRQKQRIKKSQKTRTAALKKVEKIEEKKERSEEKESEKKEREEKEKKDSGGGGGGESKDKPKK